MFPTLGKFHVPPLETICLITKITQFSLLSDTISLVHLTGRNTQFGSQLHYHYLLFLYGSLRAGFILYGRQPMSQIWPTTYFCKVLLNIDMLVYLYIVYDCFHTYCDRDHLNFIAKLFATCPFIKKNLSPSGLHVYKSLNGKVTPYISLAST